MTGSLQFLRLSAVAQRVGLSKRTVTRLVDAGSFPRPVSPTRGTVAWVSEEVDRWMRQRIEERDDAAGA